MRCVSFTVLFSLAVAVPVLGQPLSGAPVGHVLDEDVTVQLRVDLVSRARSRAQTAVTTAVKQWFPVALTVYSVIDPLIDSTESWLLADCESFPPLGVGGGEIVGFRLSIYNAGGTRVYRAAQLDDYGLCDLQSSMRSVIPAWGFPRSYRSHVVAGRYEIDMVQAAHLPWKPYVAVWRSVSTPPETSTFAPESW